MEQYDAGRIEAQLRSQGITQDVLRRAVARHLPGGESAYSAKTQRQIIREALSAIGVRRLAETICEFRPVRFALGEYLECMSLPSGDIVYRDINGRWSFDPMAGSGLSRADVIGRLGIRVFRSERLFSRFTATSTRCTRPRNRPSYAGTRDEAVETAILGASLGVDGESVFYRSIKTCCLYSRACDVA